MVYSQELILFEEKIQSHLHPQVQIPKTNADQHKPGGENPVSTSCKSRSSKQRGHNNQKTSLLI